jgi:phospholipid/cholesterol/gamma-HCH transport system substrate-binding protein
VDHIDLDGSLAKVTFRIAKDQVLDRNTLATVTYQNIIGQRYLGLSPGAGDDRTPLTDGAQIPPERTRPSFDIAYLLNGFEPLFAVLDPKQVDNLTMGIIEALQGDSGSVLQLLTQTSALAESLAGPDQTLGTVVTNLATVTSNLAAQNTNLQAVIGQTRDAMVALADRREQLVASARSITTAVARLAMITTNIFPDLQQLIGREPGLLAHLAGGDGQPRFAYLGANLPYLLKGLARVTQEGSYLNAYACNANLTIFAFLSRLVPAVVRLASPGNIVQQSPICR